MKAGHFYIPNNILSVSIIVAIIMKALQMNAKKEIQSDRVNEGEGERKSETSFN